MLKCYFYSTVVLNKTQQVSLSGIKTHIKLFYFFVMVKKVLSQAKRLIFFKTLANTHFLIGLLLQKLVT